MDGKSILKKIIEEEGSCCWSKPSICALCPIGKLKKNKNGSDMNCVDAIAVDGLTEEAADAKYKEAAIRLLLDETIDDMLGGDLDVPPTE